MAASPPFNCPGPLALLSDRQIYREEGRSVARGKRTGGEMDEEQKVYRY